MTSFFRENEELGSALEKLLHYYTHEGKDHLSAWQSLAAKHKLFQFLGMGTSEFTPLSTKWYLLELGYTTCIQDAGEWFHYKPSSGTTSFLPILISQSGESIEIRKIIEEEKVTKPFVAITNAPESFLGRAASLTLPLCAGKEKSITTKTYTNTLAVLYLMTASLDPESSAPAALDDLKWMVDALEQQGYSGLEEAVDVLLPADALSFVARGPALVCAKQSALTFMEGTRCVSSAFTGGAFNHGPFESVAESFRLVVFSPDGPTAHLTEKTAERAAGYGAGVVMVTDRSTAMLPDVASVILPDAPAGRNEELFPILAAPVHNHMLHLLAAGRGLEAGSFRYGSKVTGHE